MIIDCEEFFSNRGKERKGLFFPFLGPIATVEIHAHTKTYTVYSLGK